MQNFQKQTRGFTLIETIVALAVLLAAIVGPVALITKGLVDVTFAKNKLIALHLAQEGIELVRIQRDNNILCDYLDGGAEMSWKWDHEAGGGIGNLLDPQPEGDFTTMRVDSSDLESDTCGSYTVMSPDFRTGSVSSPLRINGSGFYQYSSGSDSPFVRAVAIDMRIVGGELAGDSPSRMEIVSTVIWTERGQARTVVLKDALYHWR